MIVPVGTISGIEAIAMLRKNQSVFSELNWRVLAIAEQINLWLHKAADIAAKRR